MSDFIKGAGRANIKREQIKKRMARTERGEKTVRTGHAPLRDDIARIDQDLLRLLLKRYNLAAKMSKDGKMPAADEKFLREKWQDSVARISKDADLSSRFFALLQEISFLPRPEEVESPGGVEAARGALSFAPPKKKLNFSLDVPADTMSACAWAYMAAASGQVLLLENAPDNSPARDCMNAFIQMGANLSRDKGLVQINKAAPLGRPDRVLYAGDSAFNFFLYLAHYLGKPSRVKITGGKALSLADFSFLRRILPALGARMVNVVPRSDSLPVRVECSGLLPAGIEAVPELPPQFFEALLLASPFYERPFAIDFSSYTQRERVFTRIMPIFEQSGVIFTVDGASIGINPSAVKIPVQPRIPMNPVLAAFLLLFPEAAGGKVKLLGLWPKWPECALLEKCFLASGASFKLSGNSLGLEREKGIGSLNMESIADLIKPASSEWEKAFVSALAVCACLHKAQLSLPRELLAMPVCQDFLRACGLEQEEGASLHKREGGAKSGIWNAPSAVWALALAVCACARSDNNPFRLGNPGIVSKIWIPFWNWYRSLLKGEKAVPQPDNSAIENKNRRRIRTSAEAVLPEIKEEDY